MDIADFNRTLSWLDEFVLKAFDSNEFDMVIELNAGSGGPGENVAAFFAFRSVCFISIPMVMNFADSPQIRICNYEQALSLMPIGDLYAGYEEEIKEGIMKVVQILDGSRELPYFVACYKYEMWQLPKEWSYSEE